MSIAWVQTMSRIKRLTVREVTSAKPEAGRRAAMLADGGNLYLQATLGKDGGVRRSWVFRYELDGVRHDLGLGSLDTLNLVEAREKARGLRQQLVDGIDPFTTKREREKERLAKLAAEARAMTFRQCAEECIRSHRDGWKNPKHRQQWGNTLATYAYPLLGDLAIDDISTAHVVRVLQPIWKEKPETASRVRGRIEKVLGWATVRGFRSGDNPARWRGHLQELFAAKGKVRPVKHHAALPYTDVPAFMADLRSRNSLSARALEFTVLTAVRTGETIDATWDEIDFAAKIWTIPAPRMKAGKAHRVPLSDRAAEILTNVPREGEHIFPLSNMAMLELLRGMRAGATVHGFRSSFRDWAAERTSYPNHVAEAALAHTIGDKVEKAYRRGDLFEKRRRLMADWAQWCSRPMPTSATVTPLHKVRADV
jgi:integrase